MKKLLFGLIATFMLSSLSFGQSKLTSRDLEFVGVEHNKVLDLVYSDLSNDPSVKAKKLSEAEVLRLGEQYLQNRLKNYSFKGDLLAFKNNLLNDIFTISSLVDIDNLITTDAASKLDPKANGYIINIKDLLTTGPTYPTVNEQMSLLESRIATEKFDESTLILLYSATNVARYSSQYWNTKGNGEKWTNLGTSGVAARVNPIVKADVAGAVGGAVGAAVVNVVPGAGQVAYGSAIIAGGVGSSVRAAILSWWD
jgi:hypothetical protein